MTNQLVLRFIGTSSLSYSYRHSTAALTRQSATSLLRHFLHSPARKRQVLMMQNFTVRALIVLLMIVTQRGADTRFEPVATVMLGSPLILPRCISAAHNFPEVRVVSITTLVFESPPIRPHCISGARISPSPSRPYFNSGTLISASRTQVTKRE